MAAAWSSRAQSTPAVRWPGPAAGRVVFDACCIPASSLLVPVGRPPSIGAGTRLPVRSLFGARRRSALSTVGASRVTTGPRSTHPGLHGVEGARRWPGGTSGGIGSRSYGHRHDHGAPVREYHINLFWSEE